MFSVRSTRPPADVKQSHTCDPERVAGSRRVYYERINLRGLAARGRRKCPVDATPIAAEGQGPTGHEEH